MVALGMAVWVGSKVAVGSAGAVSVRQAVRNRHSKKILMGLKNRLFQNRAISPESINEQKV